MKAHLLKLNDGSKGSRSKIIHHPKLSTDPSAGYLRYGVLLTQRVIREFAEHALTVGP